MNNSMAFLDPARERQLQQLANLLQENLGNKLTSALVAGIVGQYNEVLGPPGNAGTVAPQEENS